MWGGPIVENDTEEERLEGSSNGHANLEEIKWKKTLLLSTCIVGNGSFPHEYTDFANFVISLSGYCIILPRSRTLILGLRSSDTGEIRNKHDKT